MNKNYKEVKKTPVKKIFGMTYEVPVKKAVIIDQASAAPCLHYNSNAVNPVAPKKIKIFGMEIDAQHSQKQIFSKN